MMEFYFMVMVVVAVVVFGNFLKIYKGKEGRGKRNEQPIRAFCSFALESLIWMNLGNFTIAKCRKSSAKKHLNELHSFHL